MQPAYTEFQSLMRSRRYTEAAALAERELVATGDRSEFWFTQLSNALRLTGEIDGALQAAVSACELAPTNAFALLARAEALYAKESFDEARVWYQDALSNPRTQQRARRGILRSLSRLGQWDQILELTVQWAMDPLESFPWKTRALAGMGKLDEAGQECDRWLAAAPDNPDALWQRTELWIETDGLDATRTRLGRLARIPGKPPIYGEIHAALCRRSGKAEEAARQYGRLLDTQATPALQRKHVFALAKSGREHEAIPLLEEFLRDDPTDQYLNNGYIGACKRAGQLEHALAFYGELLERHPGTKSLFGRIARVKKALATQDNRSRNTSDDKGAQG
jgi:tetratricopeptide (TPR) repeat protein